MHQLLGLEIPEEDIERILSQLEIRVTDRQGDQWHLLVPRYRVDVTRDVDVIEDILRIYGYNRVELSGYIHANLSPMGAADRSYSRRLLLSEQLTGAGFNEILCNSLSSESYYEVPTLRWTGYHQPQPSPPAEEPLLLRVGQLL